MLIADDIRSLMKVKFSVNATDSEKDLEEQAYLHFEQFLTDADGMLHTYMFSILLFSVPLYRWRITWLLCERLVNLFHWDGYNTTIWV